MKDLETILREAEEGYNDVVPSALMQSASNGKAESGLKLCELQMSHLKKLEDNIVTEFWDWHQKLLEMRNKLKSMKSQNQFDKESLREQYAQIQKVQLELELFSHELSRINDFAEKVISNISLWADVRNNLTNSP